MSAKVVTDFRILMRLAAEVGKAEKSGDAERLAHAKAQHDAYRDLCLEADSMALGCRYGDLL